MEKYFHVYIAFGNDLIIAIDCVGFSGGALESKYLHKYYCDTKQEAEDFCRGVIAGAFYTNVGPVKTYIIDNTPKSAVETIEESINNNYQRYLIDKAYIDC